MIFSMTIRLQTCTPIIQAFVCLVKKMRVLILWVQVQHVWLLTPSCVRFHPTCFSSTVSLIYCGCSQNHTYIQTSDARCLLRTQLPSLDEDPALLSTLRRVNAFTQTLFFDPRPPPWKCSSCFGVKRSRSIWRRSYITPSSLYTANVSILFLPSPPLGETGRINMAAVPSPRLGWMDSWVGSRVTEEVLGWHRAASRTCPSTQHRAPRRAALRLARERIFSACKWVSWII